jgi:hypothetical protein
VFSSFRVFVILRPGIARIETVQHAALLGRVAQVFLVRLGSSGDQEGSLHRLDRVRQKIAGKTSELPIQH